MPVAAPSTSAAAALHVLRGRLHGSGASWGTAASAAARATVAGSAAVLPVTEGRVGGGVLSGWTNARRCSLASSSSERRCFSASARVRYAREGDPQRVPARGMGPVRGQDPADQSLPVQTVETTVSPSGDSHGFTEKVIEAPGRPIYLDMQATTPTDPRVVDAMLPFMSQFYGNPHSRTHQYGWEAEKAVEEARKHVAALIHADPKEIVFTSGATESNNMSIKGVARFYSGKKNHIITTQTEHKCVLDSCRVLQEEGFQVTYLPVNSKGIVSLDDVRTAIQPETALVSIMTVNNEIGVIQPVEQIGAICREKKVFFHTDAAQAFGKIPLDVNKMNIDLMSISGHKLYGPKGIGALYVRRKPRVRLEPIQSGGGQERGLRSGTVPTPLAVGLGEACRICLEDMEYDDKRIRALSDRLIRKITGELEHVVRNGDPERCYPGCVNLSFAYVEGESLLMALKDVALSSGSACTSASLEPSYVLRALGAEEDMAHSSIRFGIGRFTTEEEIDFVAERVIKHVRRLRDLSPLWEMVQEGIDLKTIQWTQH